VGRIYRRYLCYGMPRYDLPRASFAILVLLVCLIATQSQAAAFEVRRAVNIAQWFTWPRYESPGSGIAWPPYRNTPAPADAELAALRKAGFDAVRLPVDPAPFMVFRDKRREAVYKVVFDAVARIERAGLNVIIDLHPNSRHPVWGQHAVVAGLESPTFAAFMDAVEEVARRIGHNEHVALELINEPRLKCRGAEQQLWQTMLRRLVERARAGNPHIGLIATGACISAPMGLVALDPASLGDKNLIYTFHFYEPFTFTHQGAAFIPWPDRYLDQVPWPAEARPIDQPLATLATNMKKVGKLDTTARLQAEAGARNNLVKYYGSKAGPALIEQRFAEVSQWAQKHGLPANRIFVGEFGALRKEAGKRGARCEDRMRWLSDVRKTAERHDFGWGYFSYDGPFSLIVDDKDRRLDTAVLAALGLDALDRNIVVKPGCR
jgi:endoglucanase